MTNYSNLQQLPIAQLPYWSHTRPTNPKFPYYSVKDPTSKLTLEQAIRQVELSDTPINLGFIASSTNPYIIIDIDDSTIIPACFATIISADLTYTEYSYSGKGLHVILELSEEAYKYYKQDLQLKIVKAGKNNNNWQGQYAFSNNFMVMTGNKLPESPLSIAAISLESMKNLMQVTASQRFTNTQKKLDKSSTITDFPSFLTFGEMKRIILGIPLDQRSTIREAYEKLTGEEYSHYDLWLKVGMAIHYESSLLQKLDKGYKLFLEWSKTDPTAYTGEEAVHDKWVSFSSDSNAEGKITGDTLRALCVNTTYKWPDTIKGKPDVRSVQNMEYAFSKLDLQFFSAPSSGLYVKGSPRLLNTYFNDVPQFFNYKGPIDKDLLKYIFTNIFQQEFGWKGLHWTNLLRDKLVTTIYPMLNPVATWLNTPIQQFTPEQRKQDNMDTSPKDSTLENFLSCFKFSLNSDEDLCRLEITRFLMHIIKMSRPTLSHEPNEGILILSGAERTYKTSFFRYLLPTFLDDFYYQPPSANYDSDKNKRDFGSFMVSKAIVNLDECDTVFKTQQLSSEFKSLLTSTNIEYVPIYTSKSFKSPRLAVLGGTTNMEVLQLSDTGARRIWFVRIKSINKSKMEKISRYHLFKDIERIFDAEVKKGHQPWVMSEEESKHIVAANVQYTAKSPSREVLYEMFPVYTTEPMSDEDLIEHVKQAHERANNDHPHCYTLKRLQALIREKYPYIKMPSYSELRHITAEISRLYVKRDEDIQLPGNWIYSNGLITYKNDPKKRYPILPELSED